MLAGGIEAGIDFNIWKGFMISGNLSVEKSDLNPDLNAYLSSIPPLKTNLSVSNSSVYKNLGFAINWRWTDAVDRYFNDLTPEVNNSLPANNVIDAQVTYAFQKINTTVRLGASNLLNHYYLDVPLSASVGGVYYVSLTYAGR